MTSKWEKLMTGWRSRFMVMLTIAASSTPVLADNAIQAINSTQQAGSEVVRIEMSEALTTLPAGFTVQTPPRIAIDLPGSQQCTRQVERRCQPRQSSLRQHRSIRGQDTLGPELEAGSGLSGADRREDPDPHAGKQRPGDARQQRSGTHPVRRKPESRTSCHCATSTSRRGADGAGRVVVELPNNQVGVDIHQQGNALVVEFLRSSLPDNLRRRLDVTDFGTPIQSITHDPERRPGPHARGASWRLGTQRLPERQPVRARGPGAEGRSQQAGPGRRLCR